MASKPLKPPEAAPPVPPGPPLTDTVQVDVLRDTDSFDVPPTGAAEVPAGERSDGSLLRVLAAGDPAAAQALYDRYASRVLAVARAKMSRGLNRRVDADDIAQSVFRRFFHAASSGRYDLPSGQELWELLLVITLNRLRSAEQHHRARKRDLRVTVGWEAGEPAGQSPATDPVEAMLGRNIEEAVARLPESGREIVRLRMAGWEVAQIAEQAGRSKRTVERILQDTRARLKSLLELEPAHADPRDDRTPPPGAPRTGGAD